MILNVLKAKLHRATVTEANLEYNGSVTIDQNLLDASGIRKFEQVHIYNITNGERFVTYAIEGPRESGVVCLNGAAARLVSKGDLVIICAYAQVDEQEFENFQTKVILLDEHNRIADNLSH